MRIIKDCYKNIIWKNKTTSLFIFFWSFFLFKPTFALALPFRFDPLRPPPGLEPLIAWIFYYVLIVSGLILVAVLIRSGFSFLFSTGSPDRLNEAKSQLQSAFIGLLLVLSAVLILTVLNPELIPDEIIQKHEVPPVALAFRQSGVSFCYETKVAHFKDIDFRCAIITQGTKKIPSPFENQEKARYGKVQKHYYWDCFRPQIKHEGKWVYFCDNLAASWLEMVDINVFFYYYEGKPKITLIPDRRFTVGITPVCDNIFGGRCIRLASAEEKCYVVGRIRLTAPKYQCHSFRTSPEIRQKRGREFTHYRIVKKTIKTIENGVVDEEEIDFGIIFYEQRSFEKGGCSVYISPDVNYRGKVHLIGAMMLVMRPPWNIPVQGNFHSARIFSINREAKRGPARVFLYQGVKFTRDNPKEITLGIPDAEIKVRRNTLGVFNDNVRSIRIKREPDVPIIVVLFSTEFFGGFCDVFMECDSDLSNNKIGRERAIDPGQDPPIRLPWLFFAPTAESIIIIAGEQI